MGRDLVGNVGGDKTKGFEVAAVCFLLGGAIGYVLGSYVPVSREVGIFVALVGTAAFIAYAYFAYNADRGTPTLYALSALSGAALATALTLA